MYKITHPVKEQFSNKLFSSHLVGQWHWVLLVRGVSCPPHYQLFSQVIGWAEGEGVPQHLSVTLSVKKAKS